MFMIINYIGEWWKNFFDGIEEKVPFTDKKLGNSFHLQLDNLNTFFEIIMSSSFDKTKSQSDYWSSDPFLFCKVVSSTITRDKLEDIKLKMEYSKFNDSDTDGEKWSVLALMKL